MMMTVDELAAKMQAWGLLESPAPDAALRWIATFIEAYGDRFRPSSTIRNLGNFIATMIAGSFNTNIDQSSWEIAHSQFLFWIAVTAPVGGCCPIS